MRESRGWNTASAMRRSGFHSTTVAASAGDGFVGHELLYRGGEFSMMVIVPDEGRFAANQFVEHDAQTIDVRAAIHFAGASLLDFQWGGRINHAFESQFC